MDVTEEMVDELLGNLIEYFEEENSLALKELSNSVIEQALLVENPFLVDLSLIAYGLSKLCMKEHIVEKKEWLKFKGGLLKRLQEEKARPETRKRTGEILKAVLQQVAAFDDKEGNYITDVIEQGRIKQASRAYALGVSLRKAASLTGVSLQDLSEYVGATKIHEREFTQSLGVEERYGKLKRVFE